MPLIIREFIKKKTFLPFCKKITKLIKLYNKDRRYIVVYV